MSCKRRTQACVATDVGGVRDVIEDGKNGFLVPSGDTEKFAEAVDKLLRDPDLREAMGKSGRERVKERFSKERLIGDIERLYLELLR